VIHWGVGRPWQWVTEKFWKATGESTMGTAEEAATPAEIGSLSRSEQMSSKRFGVKAKTSPEAMSVAFRIR
jgi:hypothetical protein